MKILAVDDEKFALNKLINQLNEIEFVQEVKGYNNPFTAIEEFNTYLADVAVLDIEMCGLNGIEIAKKLKEIKPDVKVIFVTGHSDFAVDAFKIRANGYLLKPASKEEIEQELINATQDSNSKIHERGQVTIQTFGNFEVFVDGKILNFERKKAKEVLAYLVDRKGASVSLPELLGAIYEDRPDTASVRSQLRNNISCLIQALKRVGADDIITKNRNEIYINKNLIDCDYYKFLDGDSKAIHEYMGEYMINYSWAEETAGYLEDKKYRLEEL